MVNIRAVRVMVEAKHICKRIISYANFHYINQGEYVHGLKMWNDFQDLSKSITSLAPL